MHIDKYEFGSFTVDGKTYESDIKIVNNQLLFWSNHRFDIAEVRGVAEAKPKPSTIIIGTGESGVIQVSNEIADYIKSKGIRLIIKTTPDACNLYNKLSKKENVAAILHSTC